MLARATEQWVAHAAVITTALTMQLKQPFNTAGSQHAATCKTQRSTDASETNCQPHTHTETTASHAVALTYMYTNSRLSSWFQLQQWHSPTWLSVISLEVNRHTVLLQTADNNFIKYHHFTTAFSLYQQDASSPLGSFLPLPSINVKNDIYRSGYRRRSCTSKTAKKFSFCQIYNVLFHHYSASSILLSM